MCSGAAPRAFRGRAAKRDKDVVVKRDYPHSVTIPFSRCGALLRNGEYGCSAAHFISLHYLYLVAVLRSATQARAAPLPFCSLLPE